MKLKSFPQSTHLIVRSLKSDGAAASSGGNLGSGNLSLSQVSPNSDSLDFLRSRSDIDTSTGMLGDLNGVLEDDWNKSSRESSHPHVVGNGSRSVVSLSRAVGPKDLIQTLGPLAKLSISDDTVHGEPPPLYW